jgi:hypothetical protein
MTISLNRLFVVLGLAGHLAGCATSPTLTGRGTVVSRTPGTRAIVAGPIDVHAYSGFGGGEIYLVNATAGSDSDCAGTPDHTPAMEVPHDKVISVVVPAGRTACLRTRIDKGYELLWHAQAGREESGTMVAKASHSPRER